MPPLRKILPKPNWASTAGAAGIASTDDPQRGLNELANPNPLRPMSNGSSIPQGHLFPSLQNQSPGYDGQAVSATDSNKSKILSVESGSRQQTSVNCDMTQAEYDAMVMAKMNAETNKFIDPALDHNTSPQPAPQSPEDADAILPASPRSQNETPTRGNARLTVNPHGTLSITGNLGVDTDSEYFTYNNHANVPNGLKIRFLKSGSPVKDDLVYVLPQELYENLVKIFNNDLEKYQLRYLSGHGRFGTLDAWSHWPYWQDVKNKNPHACANCVDLAYGESGVHVPTCEWLLEDDAVACKHCADSRVFCIVNIQGCPTVLRNHVDRLVGEADGVGVAR